MYNTTELSYFGEVNFKIKLNNKIMSFKAHNEGLNAFFKYLCKIISGNGASSTEAPAYIDIRCNYQDTETDSTQEKSLLYGMLSLTSKEYLYEDNSWKTRLKAVISYSMIDFDTYNLHSSDIIYIYLVALNGTDYARLKLDKSKLELSSILPGMQAIIEWNMYIQNK